MGQYTIEVLRAGDVGIVDRIIATRGAAKRLADMGFVHGTRVEMVRPGSPCIVRVDGACVALGQAHQSHILLLSCNPGANVQSHSHP